MIFIVLVEIALFIAGIVLMHNNSMNIESYLKKALTNNSSQPANQIHDIQSSLKCCGINAPYDWVDIGKVNRIPASCCLPEYIDEATKDCYAATPLFKDKYYQEGCSSKMHDLVKSSQIYLIVTIIILILIQFIAGLVACCLAKNIQKEQSEAES